MMPASAQAQPDWHAPDHQAALPAGTAIAEYRLERVLGAGGFGITYLAWDAHLEKHVAIKEYLPASLALRALDGSVVPLASSQKQDYAWGLDRFVKEARTLARFAHPHIVRVNRYLEANGTAYMVMDYESGDSLYQRLRRGPALDERALAAITGPLLDGLEAVHAEGFLHRDIKPSNIFLRENGTPVLLDFGSARRAASGQTQALTAIVSPGYAPPEQYLPDGEQGPWTDIYSFAAVLLRVLSGRNPPEAVARLRSDPLPALMASLADRASPGLLAAIGRGMALAERERPQSVAQWRPMFALAAPPAAVRPIGPARAAPAAAPPAPPSAVRPGARVVSPVPATASSPPAVMGWLGVAFVLFAVAGYLFRPGGSAADAAVSTQKAAAKPMHVGSERPPEPIRALPHAAFAAGGDTLVVPPAQVVVIEAPGVRVADAAGAVRTEQRSDVPAPSPATSAPAAAPSRPQGPQVPDAYAEGPRAPGGPLAREFRDADIDRDGHLTRTEARGQVPLVERRFDEIDVNRDGRVSFDELMQFRRAARERGEAKGGPR